MLIVDTGVLISPQPDPTKKQFKIRQFSSDAEVIAAAETWLDGQPSDFFFEWLAKSQSLVALACFLPGGAKDLSAPRHTLDKYSSQRLGVCSGQYVKKIPVHSYGLNPTLGILPRVGRINSLKINSNEERVTVCFVKKEKKTSQRTRLTRYEINVSSVSCLRQSPAHTDATVRNTLQMCQFLVVLFDAELKQSEISRS